MSAWFQPPLELRQSILNDWSLVSGSQQLMSGPKLHLGPLNGEMKYDKTPHDCSRLLLTAAQGGEIDRPCPVHLAHGDVQAPLNRLAPSFAVRHKGGRVIPLKPLL